MNTFWLSISLVDLNPQSLISSNFLRRIISERLNNTNFLTWKHQILGFVKRKVSQDTWMDLFHLLQNISRRKFGMGMECLWRRTSLILSVKLDGNEIKLRLLSSLPPSPRKYWYVFLMSIQPRNYGTDWWRHTHRFRGSFRPCQKDRCPSWDTWNKVASISGQLSTVGYEMSEKDKSRKSLGGLRPKYHVVVTSLQSLPQLFSFEDLQPNFCNMRWP